jgi:hypothetical protein
MSCRRMPMHAHDRSSLIDLAILLRDIQQKQTEVSEPLKNGCRSSLKPAGCCQWRSSLHMLNRAPAREFHQPDGFRTPAPHRCPLCLASSNRYLQHMTIRLDILSTGSSVRTCSGRPDSQSISTAASHLKILLDVCNKFDGFLHRRLGHLHVDAIRVARAVMERQQHPWHQRSQVCYIASGPLLELGRPTIVHHWSRQKHISSRTHCRFLAAAGSHHELADPGGKAIAAADDLLASFHQWVCIQHIRVVFPFLHTAHKSLGQTHWVALQWQTACLRGMSQAADSSAVPLVVWNACCGEHCWDETLRLGSPSKSF